MAWRKLVDDLDLTAHESLPNAHHPQAHDHSLAADGNVVDPGSALKAPRKTDPATPAVGELWINGALLKYRDNQATPVTQTIQKRGDVITDAEHGSRGAGLHADSHSQSHSDADHTGPNKVEVQDEGAVIATRARLNFVGAGVTVSDDSANNRVNISIPGGGGGGGPHDHTTADGTGPLTGDEHDTFSEYAGQATPPATPGTGKSRFYARTMSQSSGTWQRPEWLDELGRLWALAKQYPVRAFGAKGDGTTDDTAAIQAAIDAAFADGGGTVVFDEGVYRITAALQIKSKVRLLGMGYNSIIRQDTAGAHGIRALPVARPTDFDARTGPPTNPHVGVAIEHLHLASGVDWTQAGKPTAGVAIYLSSSRLIQIHNVWIDGYPDYRTRRWAGGIWFDDVDPGNIPCRHSSVTSFFIQSIGDDPNYAGDADSNIAQRRVGHCGILLRMVNSGADGASAWGHNFINGIVQTEHATDSMEYWDTSTNSGTRGWCGYRNCGSDGTHFENVEFIDFHRPFWLEADGDFSPWGLSNSRYNSVSAEVPGVNQPAGYFRGSISQHEFYGCNFYGSGLPEDSRGSYGVDIDCLAAAELRFADCLFSAHEDFGLGYRGDQAIRIANSFGQLWKERHPRFLNCSISSSLYGIQLVGSAVSVGVISCIFHRTEALPGAAGVRQTPFTASAIETIQIVNCYFEFDTALAWTSINVPKNVLFVGNSIPATSTAPVAVNDALVRERTNLLMLNSHPQANFPYLSHPTGSTERFALRLQGFTSDSTVEPVTELVFQHRARYTTEATQQVVFAYDASDGGVRNGQRWSFLVEAQISSISPGGVAAYSMKQAFLFDGTAVSAVGSLVRNLWEQNVNFDAVLDVSGTQIRVLFTPIGSNPTVVHLTLRVWPAKQA